MYNDYVKIKSEAQYESIHETGLKILTPKQVLQRLPIALAQVKVGNDSENVLNEIKQILYLSYQSKKKLLRKYTVI